MSLNSVFISGNLTKDPESFSDGKVAKFSIATNFKSGKDRDKDEVEYTDVVCFGYVADAAMDNLKKGMACLVSGRKSTRKWQDKEGNNRYSVEVIALSVYKQLFSQRRDDDRGDSRGDY